MAEVKIQRGALAVGPAAHFPQAGTGSGHRRNPRRGQTKRATLTHVHQFRCQRPGLGATESSEPARSERQTGSAMRRARGRFPRSGSGHPSQIVQ